MVRCLKSLINFLAVAYFGVYLYGLINYNSRIIFTTPDFLFEDSNFFMISHNDSNHCQLKWSDLGPVELNISNSITLEDTRRTNPNVKKGGKWRPLDCEPWQRVAILVPYRDRAYHLRVMLNRLHPMLQKQKLSYQIFVVVQAGEDTFNKGRLFNIGFIEAMGRQRFDCIIAQDVDLLPETDNNIYVCDQHARHLAPAIDELRYHPIFNFQFGGVTALSTENYIKVNGYSNRYAGWGNEDDDMSARTIGAGLLLTRPPYHIGRYKMVRHMKSGRSEHGYKNFLQWRYWWKRDGLNTLSKTKYKILKITEEPLYTNITVDVGLAPEPPGDDIPQESMIWFLWFFFP